MERIRSLPHRQLRNVAQPENEFSNVFTAAQAA